MSRILYVQYTNPAAYPPLEHSSRLLADAGWHVMFAGTSALGASTLRFPPHDRITVRQMPGMRVGWRQKLHYARFALWVLVLTLRWAPRWIYASDHLSCPIALLLSYLPGRHVIYHEHDSPGANGSGLFHHVSLRARRSLAQRAKLCVLPNQRRAERFTEDTGRLQEVLCVWNCPSRQEVARQRNGTQGDELWVLYHGSIVPSRLPAAVIDALKSLPSSVKLRVIGYETIGHQGYVNELVSRAERLGIAERIEFVGSLPERGELLAMGSRCDVGLAFMPSQSQDFNEQTMYGASNKPFDYLSCGLALLVSDLPDWKRLYVQPGYGRACDSSNPDSIAEALRWYVQNRGEARRMGELGRQRIATEWNYETQFSPVLELLNQTP